MRDNKELVKEIKSTVYSDFSKAEAVFNPARITKKLKTEAILALVPNALDALVTDIMNYLDVRIPKIHCGVLCVNTNVFLQDLMWKYPEANFNQYVSIIITSSGKLIEKNCG